MRLGNAETMLWLIYGHPCPVDDLMAAALEAYVNGIPLPPAMTARLWQLVRAAETVARPPSPTTPSRPSATPNVP